MTDYYKILDVPKNASLDEIKSAFRRLAHQYHPDVSTLPNSRELFLEINEAYNYLVQKIKIENKLKNSAENKYKDNAQVIIDNWMATERDRIRSKAGKYADYKFARFRFTKIYRTTEFITHWLSIGTLIFGIIVLFDAVRSTIFFLSKYKKIDFSYIASCFIIIFLGILITAYSAYKIYFTHKNDSMKKDGKSN